MTITNGQRYDMLEAAKPLMEWLNENCHPHCTIIVDQSVVRLNEEIAADKTGEFLKD